MNQRDAENKAYADYVKQQMEDSDSYFLDFNKAQDAWQKQANDNYQKQLDLKTQIASLDEKNVEQMAVLQQELKATEAEYQKYGKDVRGVAENTEAAKAAQEKLNLTVARANEAKRQQQQAVLDQWANRGIMVAGRAAFNLVGNTVTNASHFVQAMDSYLTEIQMATRKSDEQMVAVENMINRTAQTLRVTPLSVASAASTFYHQGLDNSGVEDRLLVVSKFAKVAQLDFSDAADIITAISQSMADDLGNDVQRIADVLSYMGDKAATTASEVGVAMQRLSPIASAVGVSFESAASYVAAASAITRNAPTRVFTGIRAAMARYYSVTKTNIGTLMALDPEGTMQEFETAGNDVVSMLDRVGVAAKDARGQLIPFDQMMEKLAKVWATLPENSTERSDILTALGGQRGMDVLAALLNDISSENSIQRQLYTGAIESYGTVSEKYAIWMDSAAAAQERYNAALQEMYAVLNVEVVKAWYGAMALVAHYTALSTKSFAGFNLIVPAIIAGFVAIKAAILATGQTTLTFGTILSTLSTAMQHHPLMAAATIFVALATTISVASGVIIDAIENTRKAQIQQYNDAIDVANKAQQKVQTFTKLKNEMNAMFNSSSNVTGELEKYNTTLEALAKISPTAAFVVQQLKDGLIDQKEAARLLNEELDKTIDRQLKISAVEYQAALEKKVVSDSVKGLVYPTDRNALTYRGSDYVDYLNQFGADNWANTLQLLYEDYSQWLKAPMINQRQYTSPIAGQLVQ